MIDPLDYDDIIVTVAHPWGDGHPTLTQWIASGPGEHRPLVGIVAAKRGSTGDPIDLGEIPLEYHNSRKSRRLQREGSLPTPWGPPPDDPPMLDIPINTPPHIRRMFEDD
ncbi:hypothetical protein FB565_003300 [Actinoplanes lutulentus]|uniref:Uncharacterized protein n=1 Tax=Actinoplanes lutulentus TaxID=1287878 RepID=A0A327Z8H5_9ACTN|nr:hypothetical protein [Actinoplanes lutulentus]MBB2943571.1 hypothetical protein [Actinoplanes lutulentus]RAK27437.1 hypothetical protein B0I29_12371 [Actinoplanes lutulentus]